MLAAGPGLEPRYRASEARVLPLDDPAMRSYKIIQLACPPVRAGARDDPARLKQPRVYTKKGHFSTVCVSGRLIF